MSKIFSSVSALLVAYTFLVGCSSNEISSTDMKIIGDLRWDKLTTYSEWNNRFRGCLDGSPSKIYPSGSLFYSEGAKAYLPYIQGSGECRLDIGGVTFYIKEIRIDPQRYSSSGELILKHTSEVILTVPNRYQLNAFKEFVREKHDSDYTKIDIRYDNFVYISPTSKLLNSIIFKKPGKKVNLDASEF